MKRIPVLLLCIALVAGLAACQTPAGRSAGQVVDDATITTVVKAKIIDEPTLSALAISVSTFRGEVTLTGAVPTEAQRQKAASLAWSAEGVRNVNNLLEIKR